jgi:hypothetical protein
MVALDDRGQPVRIPPVIAETPDERRRMEAAKIRRAQRKVLQAKLKRSAEELEAPAAVATELVHVERE